MKRHPFAIATLLIVSLGALGCASKSRKPEPVIVTEKVEVPVLVKPKPIKPLLECGQYDPNFEFKQGEGKDAILPDEEQHKFKEWLWEKQNCLKAWQDWAVQ